MFTFSRLGNYGRLGNQLFQIASTTGQALLHEEDVTFPPWKYSECFDYPFPSYPVTGSVKTYEEPCYAYRPVPSYSPNVTNLFGYFQSWKYFKHCEQSIRRMFTPTARLLGEVAQLYPQILKEEDTCSIHVRRGDYLTTCRGCFTELNPYGYYSAAMREVDTGSTKFYLFSDEPVWCQMHFRHPRMTIVRTSQDIYDFTLMSLCKNNIIANSSFSWWAAWLNPHPSHRVIAANFNKWFTGPLANHDVSDLIPPAWQQISPTGS